MTPVGPTRIIAHRGNSSEAPENTFAAFDGAIAHGVTLLECDVQLTADDAVVVIHDVDLARTSGQGGDVRDLSLAEVQGADVSYPSRFGAAFSPQRVPTLEELLRHLRGRAQILVEVKRESSDPERERFEAAIANAVERSGARVTGGMDSDLGFISFDTRALERLRRLVPLAPRGHLFYRESEELMFRAASNVDAHFVMPEKMLVNEDFVRRARLRGFEAATWVCDDVDEMRKLCAMGLLGVGTNRPAAMAAFVAV